MKSIDEDVYVFRILMKDKRKKVKKIKVADGQFGWALSRNPLDTAVWGEKLMS